MYKSFSYVLTERLHDAFGDKESHKSNHADGMTIDLEDSSVMDLDQEKGEPKKRYFSSDVFFVRNNFMLFLARFLIYLFSMKLSVIPPGGG